MNIDAINEAAEREYPLENCIDDSEMAQAYIDLQTGFAKGALSEEAKQYWFEIFKAEQKKAAQLTPLNSLLIKALKEPYNTPKQQR